MRAKIKTLNIADNNGDQKGRIAVPATHISNQAGRMAFQFFNPNDKQRTS